MNLTSSCVHRVITSKSDVFVHVAYRRITTSASTAYNNSHATRAGKSPASNQSIGTLLSERTKKFEFKDLFIAPFLDVRSTYIEINRQVDALACGMNEFNITTGDRVLSCLPDLPDNLLTQLATARAGITFISLQPGGKVDPLLEKIKSHQVKGLFVVDNYNNVDYINGLYDAIPELDAIADSSVLLKSLGYPSLRMLCSATKQRYHGFIPFNYLPVGRPIHNPLPKLANAVTGDHAAITFLREDGGADTVSHSVLINTGHAILEVVSATISDRVVLSVPYSSIGYYVATGCISHGTALIQPSKTFSAEATLRSISRDKGTILFISDKDIPALLSHPEKSRSDLSTLRAVVIWGGLKGDIVNQVKSQLKVTEVYGIDHVEGKASQLSIHTDVGKVIPLPFTEAKILGA